LLSKAGFKGIERISVGDRGMLDFITATKPAPGPIRDHP
jgi:hypothetical protein